MIRAFTSSPSPVLLPRGRANARAFPHPRTAVLTRRQFLQTAATATATLAVAPARAAAPIAPTPRIGKSSSFLLLGDLHFDRPEHHDMAWVQREKPNDIRQIEGYCRNTREVTPKLFAAVRETIAELNQTAATRVACVV
jgi:hypothetical protein